MTLRRLLLTVAGLMLVMLPAKTALASDFSFGIRFSYLASQPCYYYQPTYRHTYVRHDYTCRPTVFYRSSSPRVVVCPEPAARVVTYQRQCSPRTVVYRAVTPRVTCNSSSGHVYRTDARERYFPRWHGYYRTGYHRTSGYHGHVRYYRSRDCYRGGSRGGVSVHFRYQR
ncbi:MAG: hypothetical protein KKB50_12590 [Planctomycetes bacterium]|nr:hypothetical protein [Planctomycetota bacterium]